MQYVPLVDLKPLHAEIAAELDEAWRKVTASGNFVGGQFVERFEEQWADYCGVAHCVGVSDGTAALKLALLALGIGQGDEVIVPTNTFIATWEAVAAVGAKPVAVDVDPDTLLMTAEHVLAAATPRTAAVIAVHLYGQPVDMDALNLIARRLGIAVIEDAAQAHGATWRGRRAGSLGDVGCFSFYPGKNLGALGDGGAVVTNRRDIADRVRSLGNHGRQTAIPDLHLLVGHNHRLDGIQAAVLSAKLPHLDGWNAARSRIAEQYRRRFQGTHVMGVRVADGAVSSNHLAVVTVDDREALRRGLAAQGIATGIHYAVPCHLQPAFAGDRRFPPMPVAERAAGRILSLPMFPHLTGEQVDRVASAVMALSLSPRAASVTVARAGAMVAPAAAAVLPARVAGPGK